MIRYSLQCHNNHTFEAWFSNSGDFDKQVKRNLVSCPQCNSTRIAKALMAPNIAPSRSKSKEVAVANPEATAEAQKRRELMALLRRLRAEVEKNAEYVGPRFAEEARRCTTMKSRSGIYRGDPGRGSGTARGRDRVLSFAETSEDHN